ncbi:MAG: peptidylprolyl isomerase [Candidatus Krumholzibacteriales bacterium]
MLNKLIISVLSIALALPLFAVALDAAAKDNPRVHVVTNKGEFTLELYPEKAPITVENFLYYVNSKFYDETLIHRVEKGFVLQGGGYTVDNIKKETAAPIKNEADNGLKNDRYTISMARTNEINSATSQFFINLKDNPALDHKGESQYGYAVFGKVVEGQETIDKIGKVEARMKDGMHQPVKKVIIESMRVAGKEEGKGKKEE